jgi:hypothetical protein
MELDNVLRLLWNSPKIDGGTVETAEIVATAALTKIA